jgi:hypothetical protein
MPVTSPKAQLESDGVVLYSREAETLYRLNSTAAYVWSLLETQPGALTIAQLHAQLRSEANRLNLPGSESLSPLQTDKLIRQLTALGLVTVKKGPDGECRYVPMAVRPKESHPATAVTDKGWPNVTAERNVPLLTRVKIHTVAGVYLLFAAIDLYLKFAGFSALLSRVERYPTNSKCRHSDIVTNIAALDHAQVYYPKKEMCLQRSTALTLLLRRHGHFAQMVIGTQTYPPKAHAWVEIDDQVIGDSPKIKTLYQELLRV